ncbi:MAG: DUF6558 family protein [Clostridium sp.]|nr:DUF6558 family protein [Clostridium sp.]
MSDFTFGNKDMIIFNGNYLPLAEIYCIDEDIKIENQLGVKQSVKSFKEILIDVDKEGFDFKLNFIRKDHYKEELKDIDDIFLNRVNNIFFGNDDVCDLQIGRYFHYYVIPIEGSLKRYDNNNAMFSITFKSLSPYKFATPTLNYFKIENEKKEEEITNQGLSCCYADLIVKCLKDGDLNITNKINNRSVVIINCKVGEKFKVDTENCDLINIDFNRIKGEIRDTLKLEHGDNKFEVYASGIFEVWTEHQAFYALF